MAGVEGPLSPYRSSLATLYAKFKIKFHRTSTPAENVGVLRLRSCFALRSNYSAQDDKLEAGKRCDSFSFHALVPAACGEVLVILSGTARPIDHQAIDFIELPQAEGQR
jgi:hypothetical protein